MNTLLCPNCRREFEAGSSPSDQPSCPHCGAALPPESSQADTSTHGSAPTLITPGARFPFLEPPRQPEELGRLGDYRILKVLGQGGMGTVFQAEDTRLERPVALKVMNPEVEPRDPEARKRFLREARMIAATRNDHIVTIHQVGEINGIPYLAMELLHGQTLAAWMQGGRRASPAQLLDVALQAAQGLEAAHRAGLVHRDIKPTNIWLESPSGRVKLLDFGLARRDQDLSNLTQVGMVMGTPAYMAPEQAEGAKIDPRCDLFSLGCVLYEFAAGELPFNGPTPFAILTAIITRDPKPLQVVNPAVPADLAAVVMQLLARNPEGRPPSATAVVEALETVAEAHPELQPRKRSGSRPAVAAPAAAAAPRRWRWAAVAGVVAALALVAVLGGWLFSLLPGEGNLRPGPGVQGVSEDRIVLGMTGPFSGPAAELGRSLEVGIQTYFKHVNDEGGVAGRKLELVALDDRYEPDLALANVRRLDEEYKVFGFIGNVGAPTAEMSLPYALDRGMLFFGAFTGGNVLRKIPPDSVVFNCRASLEEETGAAVKYLVEVRGIRPEQIAVFIQEDSYGDSGFRGVVRKMRDYGRSAEEILRVGYRRNTVAVEEAVQKILEHKEIRAAVMAPTYRPAARFIRQLKDAGRDLTFTCTAFVDSAALAEELMQLGPKYASGVIVTQVVPYVHSHATRIQTYREHLRTYYPRERPNSVSLEGYLTAAILVEGLRRTGDDLTTRTLIEALESIRDLDLGIGVPVNFGPSEHQAFHKVWGIILDESGSYRQLELD